MRFLTLFSIICVGVAYVLAHPGENGVLAKNEKIQIKNTLKAIDLMEISTRDWMTDTIQAILGMSVGELLSQINHSLEELNWMVNLGLGELEKLMHKLDPAIQQEIRNSINNALGKTLTDISPILDDLELVLPVITPRRANIQQAADLIKAILNKTLEELLIHITEAMQQSYELLTSTMTTLSRIADKIGDPRIAEELRNISNQHLVRGQAVMRPVLDSLYKILPSRNERERLIATVVSKSIGVDVTNASFVLDSVLNEVEDILLDFVRRLNRILQYCNDDTKDKFHGIVASAVDQAEHTMQPILNVFLQYLPTLNRTSSKTLNIPTEVRESLLGISLEDFLSYMDFAVIKLEGILEQSSADLKQAVIISGKPFLGQIIPLVDETTRKLDLAAMPFLNQISPLLGDRKWVSTEEYVEMIISDHHEKVFCDFSFRLGQNKEFILHIISKVLLFDIVGAANELKDVLFSMERLYVESAKQLNEVMQDEHPYVISQINRIIELSTNQSQIVIRPILDILMEFVPNEHIHDADYVAAILHTISGLKFDTFRDFLKFTTVRLQQIAELAAADIHSVAQRCQVYNNSKLIDRIVNAVLTNSEKIILPFVEIIKPILDTA